MPTLTSILYFRKYDFLCKRKNVDFLLVNRNDLTTYSSEYQSRRKSCSTTNCFRNHKIQPSPRYLKIQKIDMSGNTIWLQLQIFKNSPKLAIFGIFNDLLSTWFNLNVARFTHNVEWDIFCDFQTPWTVIWLSWVSQFSINTHKYRPLTLIWCNKCISSKSCWKDPKLSRILTS